MPEENIDYWKGLVIMDKNRQRQRRKIRHYVSGSYTVEMAFVFPIILGILFAILFVLFYKHDELMVQHNLREGLLQHEDVLPKKQEWKSELQENLWMVQVKSCEIKQNIEEIRGNVKVQMEWKIPVMRYFLKDLQVIQKKGTHARWQPEQMIRWKKTEG